MRVMASPFVSSYSRVTAPRIVSQLKASELALKHFSLRYDLRPFNTRAFYTIPVKPLNTSQNLDAALLPHRWNLAFYLASDVKMPERALTAVFDGIMDGLGNLSGQTFDIAMREKVWGAISPNKRLSILQHILILEIYEQILVGFNESMSAATLNSKKTGIGCGYNALLLLACELKSDSIVKTVVDKAKLMSDAWVPEIVAALKKEGVAI